MTTLDRKQVEALPAVAELRQAQELLRNLSYRLYELNDPTERGRITLARASWHLGNRVSRVYANLMAGGRTTA